MDSNTTQNNILLSRYVIGLLITLAPWVIVIVLREFGPIRYPDVSAEYRFYLFLYLLVGALCLTLGFFISKAHAYPINQFSQSINRRQARYFKKYFYLAFLLCALFPLLSLYDYLVIKGASLGSIVQTRELEHLTGPRNSLIGATVALLSGAPAVFLALIFIRSNFRKADNRSLTGFYLITIFGFATMFLSGGRNPFFIGVVFAFTFYFYFVRDKKIFKILINARLGLGHYALGAFVLAAFIYSMNLFLERSIAVGVDPLVMVETLSINYDFPIYVPEVQNSFFISVYAVVVYLIFYATHALTYMNDYFVLSYQPMLFGAYSLPNISRLADVIMGTSFFDNTRSALLVNGIYLSMPGSLYIDFGYYGSIVLGGLLNLVFGVYLRKITHLCVYNKAILALLVTLFVFAPLYCVSGISNGLSLIFIIVLFVLMSVRLQPQRPADQSFDKSLRSYI